MCARNDREKWSQCCFLDEPSQGWASIESCGSQVGWVSGTRGARSMRVGFGFCYTRASRKVWGLGSRAIWLGLGQVVGPVGRGSGKLGPYGFG